ncbi:hypothetical protein B1207_08030 [Legionella quinlivanii]|uniref:Glycosyltransferase RgtA/B/C/D-like domain-containing protein n=1 Tax=Legionella quinlivanii TaxID=45073 RepID=A0A364LJQ1_9GAMM|nr:hypothetical protein [Legionella quinlivanii]RAP36738.1 hypothetical protein B1207_08030 [Legionella quinlivanii]
MSLQIRMLFVLVCGLYLFTFPYLPKWAPPNEISRLAETIAIVDHHKLSINEVIKQYGTVGDLSFHEGHYYSTKAPLLGFAAVPVYEVLKKTCFAEQEMDFSVLVYWARLFVTILPTLGLLILLNRFLLCYVSAPVASAVVATYALGTLAFSYSLQFMSHQTAANLLFLAFYALWRYLRNDWARKRLLIAGMAGGAALMAEYPAGFGLVAILFYTALSCLTSMNTVKEGFSKLFRIAVLVSLGAAPFLALLMAYHWLCFGSPFESGYSHIVEPAYRSVHGSGVGGVFLPNGEALLNSFFSPLRGLFVLAPFLLLAFPGLYLQWKQIKLMSANDRAVFWFTIITFLSYSYFTASFSYDGWGWSTGPRHITPLVIFMLLPIAQLLQYLRDKQRLFYLGVAGGLCIISMFVTGLLTFIDYIPDFINNALFELVFPMFRDGYFPLSVFSFFHWLPQSVSGIILLTALLLAMMLVLALLLGPEKKTESHHHPALLSVAVASLVCFVYLGVLWQTQGDEAQSQIALTIIKSLWVDLA